MSVIVTVSPFRCRMWALHNRLECYVNEQTCKAEIDSFSKHGQFAPVLGRPLHGDASHEFELIYGARRLFVARHLNEQLRVEVRALSDDEAIIAMEIENSHRKDISPYERGRSYAQWLRGGHFQAQDDIARALKISSSQVSRLLKLARLPSVIINAFTNPADICESWGLDLVAALDDPGRRERTLHKARLIGRASPRPRPEEVYRELLAAAACGRKLKTPTHDEVVRDDKGAPLFRIRHQRTHVALLLPLDKVSAGSLDSIRGAVAQAIQETDRAAEKPIVRVKAKPSVRLQVQPAGAPIHGTCAP